MQAVPNVMNVLQSSKMLRTALLMTRYHIKVLSNVMLCHIQEGMNLQLHSCEDVNQVGMVLSLITRKIVSFLEE